MIRGCRYHEVHIIFQNHVKATLFYRTNFSTNKKEGMNAAENRQKTTAYILGWISLIALGCCASCAATHLSKKLGRWVPTGHVSYYYDVYGNSPKDMAIHGAYAIKVGVIHKEALESANQLISSGSVQPFIDNISIIRGTVSDIITVYIDVWNVAKKDHVRSRDSHVDFSTALAIHTKE